eukprot:COSAG05_NODE_314_length_11610_cov_17.223265_11_plen_626_part_00
MPTLTREPPAMPASRTDTHRRRPKAAIIIGAPAIDGSPRHHVLPSDTAKGGGSSGDIGQIEHHHRNNLQITNGIRRRLPPPLQNTAMVHDQQASASSPAMIPHGGGTWTGLVAGSSQGRSNTPPRQTATVLESVTHRERIEQLQLEAAIATANCATNTIDAQLKNLASLAHSGVLTAQEFAESKQRVLHGDSDGVLSATIFNSGDQSSATDAIPSQNQFQSLRHQNTMLDWPSRSPSQGATRAPPQQSSPADELRQQVYQNLPQNNARWRQQTATLLDKLNSLKADRKSYLPTDIVDKNERASNIEQLQTHNYAPSAENNDTAVAKWLKANRLEAYATEFDQEGYDEMEQIARLENDEVVQLLKAIPMKSGHAQKFTMKQHNLARARQPKDKPRVSVMIKPHDKRPNSAMEKDADPETPTAVPTSVHATEGRPSSASLCTEKAPEEFIDREHIIRNAKGQEFPHSYEPELWNIDGTELDMNQTYTTGSQMWYLWTRATEMSKAGESISGVPLNRKAAAAGRSFRPSNSASQTTTENSPAPDESEGPSKTEMERLWAAKRSTFLSQGLVVMATSASTFVVVVCPTFTFGELFGPMLSSDGIKWVTFCELQLSSSGALASICNALSE